MYKIRSTTEFKIWIESQTMKTQGQIYSRLERIEEYGHFGVVKNLGDHLAELKWKNGIRVYFTISYDLDGKLVIVLLGGNKNSQSSDIKIARKILIKNFIKE